MTGLVFNIQKFSLHDGAGIRTAVFFQGCNMRCKWCANPESFELRPEKADSEAKRYTVEQLCAELVKDKAFYDASGGGVTLTGGEPLLQPEFAGALCDALRAQGVGVWLETAGGVAPGIFQGVLQKCEAVLIDLKHHDNAAHLDGTGAEMALTLGNIRAAVKSGVRVIIRIPVIPGFNDSPEDFGPFAALLTSLGGREIQLLPFHKLGEHKYKQPGLEYAFADATGLQEQDLLPFADVLQKSGFLVQIGG